MCVCVCESTCTDFLQCVCVCECVCVCVCVCVRLIKELVQCSNCHFRSTSRSVPAHLFPNNETGFLGERSSSSALMILLREPVCRVGKYKLIEGSPGKYNNWYPPPRDRFKIRSSRRHTPRHLQLTQLFDLDGEAWMRALHAARCGAGEGASVGRGDPGSSWPLHGKT